MKKEYLNPTISLLAYVEENILTTSEVHANNASTETATSSVNVKMSDIIKLD